MTDKITIDKAEYADLLISAMTLQRLENGGVDNWAWYGESLNPDDERNHEEESNFIREQVKNL